MSIFKSVKKINPSAEFSYNDENIDTIVWHNGTPPIPKEQILAILPQVELDMALENLRAKRNKLLAETDYLALADNTMTEEMKVYRQKLRDITEGLTTVKKINAVKFPAKP
jgi:hypothetical protein